MSEQEIFRLQNEIERLKNQNSTQIPTSPLLVASGLMVLGIVLSFLGQPGLGYKLAMAGFAGFMIIYGLQSYLQRRRQNAEFRIRELEGQIKTLRER